MSTWQQFTDLLHARGRALDDLGVSDTALDREGAEHALCIIDDLKEAVLGGDVYLMKGHSLVSTYDSWHCDRRPDESLPDFAARSIEETRAYVGGYPNGDAWFTLVLHERPTTDESEI